MQLKMEAKKTKTFKQKTPKKENVKSSAEEKKVNQVSEKKLTPQNQQAGLSKISKKRNRSKSNTRTEVKVQQNNQNVTPDSGKKRKNLNKDQNENKKQKIDFDKNKKINTDAEQGLATHIKVIFPRSTACKDALLKILETCEGVTFVPPLTLRFKPEEVKQKTEEIKKIKIGGKPLTVVVNSARPGEDPLKRVIPLKFSGVDTNAVKKFFDAKAIDQIMSFRGTPTPLYILTFTSEKAAAVASQKSYDLNGKKCFLRSYHNKENTNATKNTDATNKDTRKENVKTEPQEQQEKKLTKKEAKKKEEPVKQEEEEEEEEEEEDSDDEVELEGSEADDDDDELEGSDDDDDELDGSDDDDDELDGEKMVDIDMGDDDDEEDDDEEEEEDDDDDDE